MINYALVCSNGHEFDGWFRNSADFDRQHEMGLVACPICNDAGVKKRLMAPNVSTSRNKLKAQAEAQRNAQAATAAPQKVEDGKKESAAPTAVAVSAPDPMPVSNEVKEKAHQLVEALREFRKQVTANSEDVGSNFAEEARKMHYGEKEKRGIYGQTSVDDAKELLEEGIEVMPLPVLPEDRN
ncbi:DUF1178 family protein [Rhodobacteraceae bacterium RKSG542]|uniref:DUF1178 family protein n=1 Tax=Pseudovibrio flavus TaxID=2529854 RepID=UPI0012BB5A73|nr:DUF1178 family protein [Pseudovibrio flavus]MTI18259.1 DUF1178 family protein [Pseudovibrio flavus]